MWRSIDVLITPTAGRHYTIAEVLADPIRLNSNLGYYTNFMNLLDLAAIAVPAGFQADGLPFGVTLAAPAWSDAALCALADALHRAQNLHARRAGRRLCPRRRPAAAGGDADVVQARGLRGAYVGPAAQPPAHRARRPAAAPLPHRAAYRLFALPGGPPARPGLMRAEGGRAIEVEVWEVPIVRVRQFRRRRFPRRSASARVELEDGEQVKGFLCEAYATEGARDITELGGWRRYLDRPRRNTREESHANSSRRTL